MTASGSSTGDSGAPRRRRGLFGSIALFLRQVVDELKKVVTPTREELVRMTGVVLAFVVFMILLVTGMDWVLGQAARFVFGGS